MSNSNSTLVTVQEGGFGSFIYMCRDMTSYPFCSLFFRQLSKTDFELPDPRTAPIGINPTCGIPRAGSGRFGNLANIIFCALSAILIFYLIQRANRRRAAVGRIEIRAMLFAYFFTIILQLLTTGSVFEQGSIPLTVLTIFHVGAVVAFFWTLLANALVATQVVEDGTASSLIPFYGMTGLLFVISVYIASDTAFGFTNLFKSTPPRELRNVGLFILLIIWPVVCTLFYFGIMSYIIVQILKEKRPLIYYAASLTLFIGSQLIYFLLGRDLCLASNRFLDSSFIATVLETASIGVLFLGWRSITESDWEDQVFVV